MRVLGVFVLVCFSAFFVIMPKYFDRGKCEIEMKKFQCQCEVETVW